MDEDVRELLDALEATLRWIDAVPADVAASLPAMPGFDRDHTDSLICRLATPSKEERDDSR